MSLKYVTIRDDDVCYYTPVGQFKKVHRLLLERDVPINVAVVPRVSDSIRCRDGGFEAFIPPGLCGKGQTYPVYDNEELVDFLNNTHSIEIHQHGFSHKHVGNGIGEFEDINVSRISDRLDEGAEILMNTFSGRPPFFVPPYDSLSRSALQEIRKKYHGVSLSRTPHELYPVFLWPKFFWAKWHHRFLMSWGQFWVLQHPGLDFSMMDDFPNQKKYIETIVARVQDVLVLCLHSWKFFTPDGQLKEQLFHRWEAFLLDLINDNKIKFLKFSEIGKIIQYG